MQIIDISTAEKSMKIMGKIGDRDVVILIDSGATSNFISPGLVRELGLSITSSRGFEVGVGGGEIKQGKEKCSGITVAVQGVEITDDFLLFELGAIDMILGFFVVGDIRRH